MTTTYVGLDLSLTAAGVARLQEGQAPVVTVVGSRPSGPTLVDRATRIQALADKIVAAAVSPTADGYIVAVEAPPYGKTPNQGSAWDRAYLWWSVVEKFINSSHPVTEISPTSLKLFGFGKGAAPAGQDSKAMMMARAAQEFPGVDFIDDNGCDALWLAAMAQSHYEPDKIGRAHV